MLDRLMGGRKLSDEQKKRIPPGQYVTEKWPVLHYGSVPATDLATWDFRVWGEVDNPFTFSWDEFKVMPRKTRPHRHPLRDPLDAASTSTSRACRSSTSSSGRSSGRRLASWSPTASRATRPTCRSTVLDDDDVLLADTSDGAPLDARARLPAPAASCPSATSGRAPSGSAASQFVPARPARLLGALRLQQQRRSVEGRALLRVADSSAVPGRQQAIGWRARRGRATRQRARTARPHAPSPRRRVPAFRAAAWARSGIGFAIGGRPASATSAT